MREILFRGKTKKGEWVYGVPVETVTNSYKFCIEIIKRIEYETEFECSTNITGESVYSNTVGQFTGLTDKNGKKVFEGDIVKFFDMVGKVCFEQGCFGIGTSNLIEWEKLEEEILPITSCDNEPQFLYNDFFISFWELLWNYNAEDNCNVCEVIGNIHDNPELLEGV